MYSRRDLGEVALASISASLLPRRSLAADTKSLATVRGVKLGAITGTYGLFTAQPGADVVDAVIAMSKQYGVGRVELVNSLIEPPRGGVCAQAPRGGGPGGGAAAVKELAVEGRRPDQHQAAVDEPGEAAVATRVAPRGVRRPRRTSAQKWKTSSHRSAYMIMRPK